MPNPEPKKPKGNTRELARKVSTHVGIRQDVVQDVIEGLVDVVIEEILNKGQVKIPDLFEVRSYKHKGGEGFSSNGPETRLTVSLNWQIRKLWGLINKGEIEPPDRNTWFAPISKEVYAKKESNRHKMAKSK